MAKHPKPSSNKFEKTIPKNMMSHGEVVSPSSSQWEGAGHTTSACSEPLSGKAPDTRSNPQTTVYITQPLQ